MEWLTQNWVWVLLAVGVLLMMSRGGMAGCGMGGHAHRDSERDHTSPPSGGEGRNAATSIDPVSGKLVDPQRAATSYYQGRVYYFESAETRQRFEASPERYAASATAAGERSGDGVSRHRGC